MSRLLRAIGIISSLIGITFSTAQTKDTGSSASKEQDVETRPIEEITVLGERTFFTLRLEIEAAEAEVYGLFNELNTNDDFDFKCTRGSLHWLSFQATQLHGCLPKRSPG
jgi:hypothetical protein